MLNSLRIVGYRGFRDYHVEFLAPVNLFVGKNNVGKTSILEACHVCVGRWPITGLIGVARRRREFVVGSNDRVSRDWAASLRHSFHGHLLRPGSSLTVSADPGTEVTVSASSLDEPSQEALDLGLETDAGSIALDAFVSGSLVERVVLDELGVLSGPRGPTRSRSYAASKDAPVYIPADGLSSDRLAEAYNTMVVRAEEPRVVDALHILDPDVTGVYFLATSHPADLVGGILIGKNGASRLPLGAYGDGMRRILALAIALAGASGNALLIDEIDTGLHYSVMPDLWRLAIGAGRDLGVQVLATSHSLDCIRGLAKILADDPALSSRVAVHKIDSRQDQAVSFSGERLLEALSMDLELR